MLNLLLVLLLVCSSALADESMQVSIPVIAQGYDCTAELYNAAGNRVQFVKLLDGVQSAFTVQCTGLGRHIYTALVADRDTEDATYDRTNYRITIDLIYDSDDQIISMVFIENLVSSEGKLPQLEFINKPTKPEPSPTPSPTPDPTPTPTPPSEYKYLFSFNKVWRGGEHGNSIDWSLYNADGTRRSKGFNKEIVNDDLWRYEAYFTTSMDDCYVLEEPMAGYVVQYENIGAYSEVTDRCHNGGTIINSKIPETGDDTQLDMYLIMLLLTAFSLFLLRRFRVHPTKSKP